MKLTKKIVALVAVLMTTASVWAGEVTVVTMLNGVESSTVGTVTPRVSETNGVCTLTVTPASGYYIDIITAEKTIEGGMAQAPRRRTTPGMDNYLQVTAPQSPYDPSDVTIWTFTMPASDYNVEVIANFKARTSIAGATLNLTLPQGGFVFNGEAKEPAVTVTLGGSTLASSNYTVDYSNNIDAGTATVTVTGKNTYTGTATKNFTISKAELSNTSVSLAGWTYGDAANTPVLRGNLGDGTVNYFYANAEAPSLEYATDVPANAGNYSVKAVIAETANYQGKEVTNTFSIAKANLSGVTIANIADQTYTGKAVEPAVTVTFNGETVDAAEYTVGYSNNTNVGEATVTLTATGVNFTAGTTATKTFQIVREIILSFSEKNSWVTYCATEDLIVPDGLSAYVVTSINGSTVQVEEIGFIPEGQGVLLNCEEPAYASDGFIAAAYNGAHSELPNNYLEGITAATSVKALATEGKSIYVLYNDEFVKTNSGTIPANRSYLPVGMDVNANARLSISFADDDEITAIERIANSQQLKANGQYYDLQGRKVAQPAKGLYIVNGRKVVVK